MKNLVGICILGFCLFTVVTTFFPAIVIGILIWLILVAGMGFSHWCDTSK